MLLRDTFYTLLSSQSEGEHAMLHHVALRPDSPIYQGHFPGKPVTPGVCEIEMVKELATVQAGHPLTLQTINLCRFKAVASPAVCPEVDIRIELTPTEVEGGYRLLASVSAPGADAEPVVYMEIKAELTPKTPNA